MTGERERLLRIAVVHHQGGRTAEAERAYLGLAALAPQDPTPPRLLALLHHQAGRQEEALRWAERARVLAPGTPETEALIGRILAADGRYEEAEAALLEVLRSKPDFADAVRCLCAVVTARRTVSTIDAIDVLGRAVREHHARTTAVLADYGRALLALRDGAAAVPFLQQCAAITPEDAALQHDLGRALSLAGRFADAIEPLRRAATLKPRDAAAAYDLGTSLRETGALGDAASAFRRALAIDQSFVAAHHNLADSLLAAGDVDGALAAFGAAYRLDRASFGPIAQDLAAGNPGRLWLDPEALRRVLETA